MKRSVIFALALLASCVCVCFCSCAVSSVSATSSNLDQLLHQKTKKTGDSPLQNGTTIIVQTKYGPVMGYRNQAGGYSFLGVPFAEPPLGNMTFMPAQSKKPWTEPVNATAFRSGCVARCRGKFASLMCPATVSRDCLYINIFVGSDVITAGKHLSALFFTHGGEYLWGSGATELYKGDYWAMKNKMIIVTTSYRLNVFGGLTSKGLLKGNNQLGDVVAALKFTHEIIGAFGGDNTRITLSGQSAGATTTLTIYAAVPSAWPYFRAAAPISAPTGLKLNSAKMAQSLGELVILKLGCFPSGDQAEVDCVSSKSDEEILKCESTTFLPTPREVLSAIMQWQPYIDSHLVVESPVVSMTKGTFHKDAALYMSDTSAEAIIFVDTIYGLGNISNFALDLAMDYVFGWAGGAKVAAAYGPVPPNYQNDSSNVAPLIWFSTILTDYLFVCANQYVLAMAEKYGAPATYNTIFQHVPSWTTWYLGPPKPGFGCDNGVNCCAQVGTTAVCHAFDLVSIFATEWAIPKHLHFPSPTPPEIALSTFIQDSVFGAFVRDMTMRGGPQRFSNATRATWLLDLPPAAGTEHFYRRDKCAMFDQLDIANGSPYNRR